MIRRHWICLAAAFWGCADDRSAGGGGFETGDLHARVVTPAGKPAARAQVWLVRSNGESAPATVLDSGFTDDSGRVEFTLPANAERGELGLDARLADSLAIAQRLYRAGDSARIQLARSGEVEAWLDSTRRIPSLFVPGSHFRSRKSDSVPKSSLRLPRGDWDVVLKSEAQTKIVRSVLVAAEAVVVGSVPWSRKNLVWTDSLELPKAYMESVLYRDPTLPSLGIWSKLDSSFMGRAMSPELATVSGAGMGLAAGPTSFSDKTYGSGVGIGALPASGALVIEWSTASPPETTLDLVRSLAIEDSLGGGFWLQLDPRLKPSQWLSVRSPGTMATEAQDSLLVSDLAASRWVVSWDLKYVYLWRDDRRVACVYRATNSGLPRVRIALGSNSASAAGKVALDSVRLYQVR